MTAIGGIALLSFIPVLQLILHLYVDIGFVQTLLLVLFTFEVGKAWIFTFPSYPLFYLFLWVCFDYRKSNFLFFHWNCLHIHLNSHTGLV